MTRRLHWADVLELRPEVLNSRGELSDLQMSLYKVAYRTADVPYERVAYYSDITEPTPGLVGFMATVAHHLATGAGGKALFHLDQGMGGGKSHALVGLYHLANEPDRFFSTDLGTLVRAEAGNLAGGDLRLGQARVVVLSADHMTPGRTSPEFGPATTLHQRFLWSLFRGDKDLYQRYAAEGPNKGSLRRALEAVSSPVLILLDELMDYAVLLSGEQYVGHMPEEQAFLNALMDTVDDLPHVAFVLVMISSEKDQRGYSESAEGFRSYVTQRVERNGTTVAVTEAQDFASIIRRRIFQRTDRAMPTAALAKAYREVATAPWNEQVFDRLGAQRGWPGFADRVARTYPFHPDLMALVQSEWSRYTGFQKVRSTVEIFAATAHHWVREHSAGRWAPSLIGVGDIPLPVALEKILSSGLLHGNEKAVQGFRQVAATDVVSRDGSRGRAVEIDRDLIGQVKLDQPAPAQRMATALFCYSLVPRSQAKRGATKAEILAAIYEPEAGASFTAAEEVFNILVSDEEGLGALEVTPGGGGGTPARYQLSTTQTLRMFYKQARAMAAGAEERDTFIWERAKTLAKARNGPFDAVIPVDMPERADTPLVEVFAEVDQNNQNRLVVLDPRRWMLLNGKDTQTREEIMALLGLGPRALPFDNGASCVVACVNTQRRDTVRKRAVDVLAWQAVVDLDLDEDQSRKAVSELEAVEKRFEGDLERAFQHYAYLVRTDETQVEWKRFDADDRTSLRGAHVWDALVEAHRAVVARELSGDYLKALLSGVTRSLSLKEIYQRFKKDPAFPLVQSDEDIRSAIFESLSGDACFEAVDSDGIPLDIASPAELTLYSTEVLLRRAVADPPRPTGDDPAKPDDRTGGGGGTLDKPTGDDGGEAKTYKQYRIRLSSTSLVNRDRRNSVMRLLSALAHAMDPTEDKDLQLVEIDIALTAAEGDLEEVKHKADSVQARWTEADELF